MIIEFEINGARVIVSGDNIAVSISDTCEPERRAPPAGPSMTPSHPLSEYVARSGISVAELAKKAGVSRMTIYRLIKGEQNATISLLEQVSAATGGKVPVSALLPVASQ